MGWFQLPTFLFQWFLWRFAFLCLMIVCRLCWFRHFSLPFDHISANLFLNGSSSTIRHVTCRSSFPRTTVFTPRIYQKYRRLWHKNQNGVRKPANLTTLGKVDDDHRTEMPRGVKIERPPPAESVDVKQWFLFRWWLALGVTVIWVSVTFIIPCPSFKVIP